jgi:hypothetical protein
MSFRCSDPKVMCRCLRPQNHWKKLVTVIHGSLVQRNLVTLWSRDSTQIAAKACHSLQIRMAL